MEKGESHRECITTSTPRRKKKKKRQDLRVEVLKNNMLQRFRSKEAASYAYKSSPVKPEPNTGAASTVVSGWARDADNDLRALILCKRGYCNCKAGAEAQVMILEEMRARPHKGYHYSSEKESRQRQLKRKNTDAAGGPALKRRKLTLLTFISLEDSEDIVQALGNTTSSACSDLPKIEEEIFSGDDEHGVLVMDTDEFLLMEMDELLNNFKV